VYKPLPYRRVSLFYMKNFILGILVILVAWILGRLLVPVVIGLVLLAVLALPAWLFSCCMLFILNRAAEQTGWEELKKPNSKI